ncbi:sulfur carrier protein ThiS [Fulvimarina sp. 2208YS6-2-32]|uniref:Sulfur carrier protein ThiS n=1 Tax=Fulvimarina uroteuthidis TaxID=3098149 RepID=A0ABU5I7L7_9HYPH|nr:sulfur carrier protein ThiS [Fulvimarina sp. 2208YS6-2-32]MDY8110196.1 sulfur carrier protein ThiS [Fulvimarina sp. 2208YS6-2-32]
MKIMVNGEPREIAAATLKDAVSELGYGEAKVATAVNESFVPATARGATMLAEGDRLEILAPRQGG